MKKQKTINAIGGLTGTLSLLSSLNKEKEAKLVLSKIVKLTKKI